MFDNLREDSSSSPLFTEPDAEESTPRRFNLPALPSGNFLGMTAAQRLVIALLLFMMVCVLGSFCLLATEKFYLPF